MVASGWLVLGGAGGGGVCRVFLFSYFRFRICIYTFFFLIFVSFVPFLGERVWREEKRRAEDASFVRKGSMSRKRWRNVQQLARFNNLLPWIHRITCRLVSAKITITCWKRYNLNEFCISMLRICKSDIFRYLIAIMGPINFHIHNIKILTYRIYISIQYLITEFKVDSHVNHNLHWWFRNFDRTQLYDFVLYFLKNTLVTHVTRTSICLHTER